MRKIIIITMSFFIITGCKTFAVTDEPFFRSREMRDTLDAYLSRIDTSYSTNDYPLITFVVVQEMTEEGSPTMLIKTTHIPEICIPSAGNSTTQSYCGVYHGHHLRLCFDTKYKSLFKKHLAQSETAKDEFSLICKKLTGKYGELFEGEAYYDIQPDGSLKRSFYRESIYSKKSKGGYAW